MAGTEAAIVAAVREAVEALELVVAALNAAARTSFASNQFATELARATLRITRARERLAEAA